MEKEVLIALKGLQFALDEEGANALETITPAEYYKRNGSHYVIFDEAVEGFLENTKNIFKFKENSLDLTKKGLINVHMIFEENKKNMTNYATPYGNILIGIDARSVKMKEQEGHIEVDVDYALEINYEHFADCKIKMDIRARNGERFSLQSQ